MGRRRRDSTVPPNPEVLAVQERLETQVGDFLRGVGTLVESYESNLKSMLVIVAQEEARKATARASQQSMTVVTATVVATQSLLDAAAKIIGTEAVAALKPELKVEEPKVGDTLKEEGEEELPHYVIRLNWDSNEALVKQLQILRQAAMKLVQNLDGITDWLALNMPDLNEENSALAEVLGAVLEQITSFVESARSIVGFPKKYLEERAAIEKELLKLPESKALQMQLELNDAETWDEMEKSWRALIRVCLIARSVVVKNLSSLQQNSETANSSAAAVYY
eukprot:CAMPEP_0176463996 /NCGR_PEP_ID=MMETSP0127-20121128/36244_1 /TAXON_ID=938130 /ORGANISM="Platyophrya macrostoma, Strain WH" /LENGTH=279 /DNA_ID=CAMNT_0017856309 /DNA_START=37 /DNA_END=876 /DNA_ORIENTATION=+